MVSVIVPVYNAEKFLGECISSVTAQTCRDIEIILVDDGSADRSRTICDRAAEGDRRIRVIHQDNRGPSAARNAGIDAARGEWLMFVDADDTITPDAVETLLKTAVETDCDIATASIFRGTDPKSIRRQAKEATVVVTSDTAIRKLLYQDGFDSCPVAKLFRRELFDTLRFPVGRNFEDLWLVPRLYALPDKIAVTPATVYFYRQYCESFMSHYSQARLDILDVTDELSDWVSKEYPALVKAADDRRFSACFGVLSLIFKEGLELPGVERRCWKTITDLRLAELTDPHVRMKNKAGALASFFGKHLIRILSK